MLEMTVDSRILNLGCPQFEEDSSSSWSGGKFWDCTVFNNFPGLYN